MKQYPPSQEEVVEAFVQWLNAGRGTTYVIGERPDETERGRREIDYILQERNTGHEIAAEVTSIWRSEKAGMEDAYWRRWTEEVAALMQGSVVGKYRVYTPLRVPQGLQAKTFADAAAKVIFERRNELTGLNQRAKGLNVHVAGADVFISQARADGSDVSFARKLEAAELSEFPQRAREAVASRAAKLKRHKELGRETWLVVYNTFWTATDISDVQAELLAGLGPHGHVDHLAIVEGDPPGDAWVNVIE